MLRTSTALVCLAFNESFIGFSRVFTIVKGLVMESVISVKYCTVRALAKTSPPVSYLVKKVLSLNFLYQLVIITILYQQLIESKVQTVSD